MRFTTSALTAVLAAVSSARAQEDCAAADTNIYFKAITHRGLKSDGSMYYQGYGGEGPHRFTPGTFPDPPTTCSSSVTPPDTLSTPTPPGPEPADTEPEPTKSPVAAPTPEDCETAFVHCGALSTCFTEMPFGMDMGWGWNVDVSSLGTETITCGVYIGAVDCVLDSATKVGNVDISKDDVVWTFSEEYGAMSFSMYSGKCPGNDAGNQLMSGACDDTNMALYARSASTYPVTKETDGSVLYNKFFYDTGNYEPFVPDGSIWKEEAYSPFPIGGEGREFLALHSTICRCGFGADCASSTKSPALTPINSPTAIPTAAPTADVCSYAFAYCPGMSKSFQDLGMSTHDEDWGWSIDVSSMQPADSITCPVYIDALGSSHHAGTQVGQVTITGGAVTWSYDNDKGAMGFSMYAGKCPVSDAGMHLMDGSCDSADEVQWFRTPKQYGLLAEFNETYMTKFYFDSSNENTHKLPKGLWAENDYKSFPIGGSEGHQFLILHATVCPCGTRGKGCSAITAAPTSSPTGAPSSTPTMSPTAKPNSPTAEPTSAPVSVSPTKAPTKKPTIAPTKAPTLKPTSSPTDKPDSPTASPHKLPQVVPISGCETSFIRCPDINIDFKTISSRWGWTNDLTGLADGETVTCDIVAGQQYIVGQAFVSKTSVVWDFMLGVASGDFHLYAGKCPFPDQAYSWAQKTDCNAAAYQPEANGEFPYVSTFTGKYNRFGFTSANAGMYLKTSNKTVKIGKPPVDFTTSWTGYNAFPMTGYMVGHSTVCPCDGKSCPYLNMASITAAPTTTVKTLTPTAPAPTETPKTPTTASPTKAPVTESPTATDATLSSSGCASSFVFCEGISYCNLDLGLSPAKTLSGWYIDLSQADDDSFLECDIIAGATGCDISTGQKIGSVEIEPEAVNWKFQFNTGGDDFHMYAGSCVVNNNAAYSGSSLNCAASKYDVASLTNYPLIAGHYDDKRVNQWQFSSDNAASYVSGTWTSALNGGKYKPFPLGLKGTTGNKFLSLHATACECRLTDGCIPVRR